MIDVIIPAYNAHETIVETLSSIAMQSINYNLKVYIVNDCSEKDYLDEVKLFSSTLDIKEIKTSKNSGPGYARQLGIDSSDSEYIVFIDADDVFYDNFSIETLYNKIKETNSNVVSGRFIEEIDTDFYPHSNDEIWMHGKIYRRSFLDEKNIRFNNTYSNEDTGFNNLVILCTKICLIDNFVYIWKCNYKSITRSSEYNFWGMEGFAYNVCWAIEEAEKRNCYMSDMAKLLFETLLEMYYRYIYYRKIRKDTDDVFKWCIDLKKYYLKYEKSLFKKTRELSVLNVFTKLYSTLGCADCVLSNDLSFNSFIDMIGD